MVDEDRVVRTPALRLRLGRNVRRVADRLRPREQPRRPAPRERERDTSRCPARGSPRSSPEAERQARPSRDRADGPRRAEETEHRVREARARRAPALRALQLGRGRARVAEPLDRPAEPVEVLVQPERPAAVDAQRLERRPPAREPLVVDRDDGPRRVDEAAPRDGAATGRMFTVRPPVSGPALPDGPSSGAPMAVSSGAAFASDSSTSSAGLESQTMPPPTQRWRRPLGDGERPDRQRELEVAVAVHAPERPIDAPRPTGSSAAIRSTAAIFGAPVIDPPGKRRLRGSRRARRPAAARPRPSRRGARRPRAARGVISSGQRTLPGSQTRERSLRSRSTIITCSAASFAEASSSARRPSGRVPLIGSVHTRSPRRARKSSGDAETIAHPLPSKSASRASPNGSVVRLCQVTRAGRRARSASRRTARRDAGRG